jgi:hypothetical protein
MCLRSSALAKDGFGFVITETYLTDLKVPTLKAMHKALHASNFLWKWLSFLMRRSVNPVIEERLMHILAQRQR